MSILTVKLPDELSQSLQYAAKRARRNKSDLVREALQQYLNKSNAGDATSALELAGDFVGRGKGPGDLSSNKRYLDDLGQ